MIPPPIQASKWLSIQVLLSEEEMRALLQELGECSMYLTTPSPSPEISKDDFLKVYGEYCKELQRGEVPNPSNYRPYFSTFWTTDSSSFVQVPLGEKKLCRAVKPMIQLQYHLMGYSSFEKKFRPMVMGKGSISWGIQFSYPTLFQNQKTQQVVKVDQEFPNTALFQTFRRWIRKSTIPTPFIVDGEQVNVPIRIGTEARKWINSHPQFREYALQVQEAS